MKRLQIVLVHICKDTKRYLTWILDAGADIISLDIEVDLKECHIAVKPSSELIYPESWGCIRKGSHGGYFILSSSCEVPIDTPPSNINAMVKVAYEFGAKRLAESDKLADCVYAADS